MAFARSRGYFLGVENSAQPFWIVLFLAKFLCVALTIACGEDVSVQTASLKDPTFDIKSPYKDRMVRVPDNGGGERESRFRLLKPAVCLPGQRYPLVFFLHGAGERGSDNAKQLKYLPTWLAEPEMQRKYPCFVLAPQCRMDERWVDISWADKKSTPQAAAPTLDLAAATAALEDVLQSEPVDPECLYLTGLSMGGYGCWDLAARNPKQWAAMLPICGGGDERTAAQLSKLPIWCFHGDADTTVPVERSRVMIEAVKAAGGTPQYSELPGVGHDSWSTAYRDQAVLDWLFAQRRMLP
ncbi:MAG: dienelactone hydrolase family protein [Planctomycetota bacterium]